DLDFPRGPSNEVSTKAIYGTDWVGVQGKHRFYPGLLCQRTMLYDRNRSFVIQDWVQPDSLWERLFGKRHTIDLLFHAMPDLQVVIRGRQVILRAPKQPQELVLEILDAPENVTPEIIRGQKKPYYLGWIYPDHIAVPAQTIRFRFQGKTLNLKT